MEIDEAYTAALRARRHGPRAFLFFFSRHRGCDHEPAAQARPWSGVALPPLRELVPRQPKLPTRNKLRPFLALAWLGRVPR